VHPRDAPPAQQPLVRLPSDKPTHVREDRDAQRSDRLTAAAAQSVAASDERSAENAAGLDLGSLWGAAPQLGTPATRRSAAAAGHLALDGASGEHCPQLGSVRSDRVGLGGHQGVHERGQHRVR